MLELENDVLLFRFPEVHEDAVCQISFQRTLRIPDDGEEYYLPPGFSRFPLEHVEDYASKLPMEWAEHGGVLLPMYQSEAVWINFSSGNYPFAIKIAAGKINAVTGANWENKLSIKPQDYVVTPDQPWLDGFCVEKDLIRQFVAMPLGKGYTAEEQISGAAVYGGIQVIAHPMKREKYEELLKQRAHSLVAEQFWQLERYGLRESASMGLAPGGLMRQSIYADPYGYDAWDMTKSSRCFVHILNSSQWLNATGTPPPGEPPSASEYTAAGLPWFDYYDDKNQPLKATKELKKLEGISALSTKLEDELSIVDDKIIPKLVLKITPDSAKLDDGKW